MFLLDVWSVSGREGVVIARARAYFWDMRVHTTFTLLKPFWRPNIGDISLSCFLQAFLDQNTLYMIIWVRQVKKYVKSSLKFIFHDKMIFFHDFKANFAKVKNWKFHHFSPSRPLPRYLLQKPQICKKCVVFNFSSPKYEFCCRITSNNFRGSSN